MGLLYYETAHPGEHVARLVKMLGLLREPGGGAKSGVTPIGNGMFFPEDFTISPALIAELKKFQGIAATLTSIDQRGQPEGLIVLAPGNADLLRGVLETAVQLMEPAEPIDGFKTYRDPAKNWITMTSRLFFFSRSREQLAAAVARLHDPKAESLGSRSDIQGLQKDRQHALAFAHFNGPQMLKQLGPMLRGNDAMIARSVLDLDHLDSFDAILGTTDDGIQLRTQLNLKPGNHNLAYSIVRTAPLSRRSLTAVPQGTAALAMIGLNPPGDAATSGGRSEKNSSVSAMDVGREIFANIEELAVFALPSAESGSKQPPMPEVGMVLAVKDAAKSEALWTQLLALPAMFGAPGATPAGEVTIEGQTGHKYQFPGGPALVVVRTSGNLVVAGTQPAVTASLKALAAGESIAKDSAFQPLVAKLTSNSSKAVLVDLGRVAQMAIPKSAAGTQKAALAGMLLKDLKVSVVTDESPEQLRFTLQATGLPNLPALIKTAVAPAKAPPAALSQE